jgi:hypothetical protein
VVAGQLAAEFVHERGLVGIHRRQRQREDQVGHVVGAVLRDRGQEERELTPRVVVQASEQAEVEQYQPPVVGQQDIPRCGSAW